MKTLIVTIALGLTLSLAAFADRDRGGGGGVTNGGAGDLGQIQAQFPEMTECEAIEKMIEMDSPQLQDFDMQFKAKDCGYDLEKLGKFT